jgi:formylglycine-generating enzyme required for sulfatase activity
MPRRKQNPVEACKDGFEIRLGPGEAVGPLILLRCSICKQIERFDIQIDIENRISKSLVHFASQRGWQRRFNNNLICPSCFKANRFSNEYLSIESETDELVTEFHAKFTSITNSIGMKLARIPEGVFMMGFLGDAKTRAGDEKQEVKLTHDFYLGIYPVTQSQFERVMRKNPSHFQGDEVSGQDNSDLPVEQVTWSDATEFCRKLSKLPEEKAAGRVYRLPTAAEWEYASQAGTPNDNIGKNQSSLGAHAWFCKNSNQQTNKVGEKAPNAWGLYDMFGNVWEWCANWHEDRFQKSVVNPRGPQTGVYRVLRGGSWSDLPLDCTLNSWWRLSPFARSYNIGFRVAMELSKSH